ncbi:MAG TPA: hypothetical protein VK088_01725 [Acidimicrobiia bacterium]|nr:hypothetical protein [Acidimicrobiia bacterium]
MAELRPREGLRRAGVELVSSFRHLAGALRVGDMRRVLTALVGFTVAEIANFIAILIYAYGVGGLRPWVSSPSSSWPPPPSSPRSAPPSVTVSGGRWC